MCKFKTLKEKAQVHIAKIGAKWKVLLYPATAVIALLPHKVHAAGGAAGALGTIAVSGSTALVKGLIGASAETAGTLAVWLTVAYSLSKIFADLFSGIFLFLINFLIGVSQYNSFLGANVVTIGWAVTRDIANMFLVVALLVIAFATILNINSYQASSLLKEFFFAAILVNFSKMICGLMIDASQVVMMTFVSGFSETAAGNFVRLFQIDGWLQLALGTAKEQAPGISGTTGGMVNAAASAATWVASTDFFTGIVTNIFTTIISFIGILAILSLDIILVVRIVTIWFLIIAAPIAFVAKVLPVTKGFSSQWWSAFMKQLIAGPLVAFIVWISLASIAVSDTAFDLTKEARQKNELFAEANNTPSSKGQVAATKIAQWENLALFFVPIVIFIMGAKWAVGVAGGAAKSITGFANKKLSGYATGGLRAFQKQAIGKGEFSVMTQAKKGWTGEGGFTTALVGGAGGYALGKIPGGQKASNFIGKGFGDRARAGLREDRKKVAVAASQFGVGDLGHKRHEVHNANEDATMLRERAAIQLAADNAAAAKLTDPAAKLKAEEAAQIKWATNQKKADEIISHAEEAQKAIFKADGLTDDGALLQEMKHKVATGHHVSEVELAAAKKMVTESVDKKVTGKIAEERQKWAAGRKAHIEAGKDPDDYPKFDENQVRGDAENDLGTNKKAMEELYKQYKAAPPINITENTNKTPTKVAENIAKEAAKTASTNLNTTHIQVANTYTAEMAATTDVQVAERASARTKLARNAGEAFKAQAGTGADPKDLKMSVHKTINMIPATERASFIAEITAAADGNTAVTSAITEAQKELSDKFKAADIQAEIENRFNIRREQKPSEAKAMSLKDLGASKGDNGQWIMKPDAISKLEAVVRAKPEFIANFGPEVLNQADIKRMIGHAIADVPTLTRVETEMRRQRVEPKARISMLRNIAESVKMTNSDPIMRNHADTVLNRV